MDGLAPLFPLSALSLASYEAPWWLLETDSGLRPVEHRQKGEAEVCAVIFPQASKLEELWEQCLLRRVHLGCFSAWEFLTSYESLSAPAFDKALKLAKAFGLEGKWLKQKKYAPLLPLEKDLRDFVQLHELGFRELKALSRFTPQDLQVLAQAQSGAQLKGNRLLRLLAPLREILILKQIELSDLLPHLSDPGLKVSELESLARPHLEQYRREFNSARQRLPQGVEVDMDPYFEKDHFSLLLTTSNPQDLAPRIRGLALALTEGKLDNLYRLL